MSSHDTELLTEVQEIIEGKSDTHGSPEDSFGRIARYWTLYLDIEGVLYEEISRADVAEMLSLFKLARAQSGEYNDDDYRDRLGYTNFANNFRND
jgi:hypothetical protein